MVEEEEVNLEIPPGYGLRVLPRHEWASVDPTDHVEWERSLMDGLLIWEEPRKEHTYTIGVDVALGIGKDRSVVTVLRNASVHLPAEEVAQFISDSIDPMTLAKVIDPIGRFYKGAEEAEALLAIENNNHGLATQSELQGHLGYQNFFIWQRWDKIDPKRRFSTAFGWVTNRVTRPAIIAYMKNAIESIDPITGQGDIIINSPITMAEVRSFQVPAGYPTYMAEAAAGAHDDALFALMIAAYVDHQQRYTEEEPLNEQRRRIREATLLTKLEEERIGARIDFQNTAISADEMYGDVESPFDRYGYEE